MVAGNRREDALGVKSKVLNILSFKIGGAVLVLERIVYGLVMRNQYPLVIYNMILLIMVI